MGRVEKTVFVSYCRPDVVWALAVHGSPTQYGEATVERLRVSSLSVTLTAYSRPASVRSVRAVSQSSGA
jgi:hypothetical protein